MLLLVLATISGRAPLPSGRDRAASSFAQVLDGTLRRHYPDIEVMGLSALSKAVSTRRLALRAASRASLIRSFRYELPLGCGESNVGRPDS